MLPNIFTMKKVQQIVAMALLIGCTFSSCKGDDDQNVSEGGPNEVSIIISDALWNGAVGDSLRKKFAAPVEGLVQEEPIFTLNQYRGQLLDDDIKHGRNIIFINQGDGLKLDYRYKQNSYCNPQNVFTLTGKDIPELIEAVQMYSDEIIRTIKQGEISRAQKQDIEVGLRDTTYFINQYDLSIKVPHSYRYAIRNESFVWLKKEIQGGNTNLLLYRVPYVTLEKDRDMINNIIRMRDSVGTLYIHGREPETYMVTEASYSPSVFMTGFKDHHALETRGNWEMKNDFMSGPFINFSIRDNKNQCYMVIEGFIYCPSSPKRDLLLELEAIIRSTKFL